MALKREDIRVIKKAISSDNRIRFKYFPNKYPKSTILTGDREVYPLKLFSRNGKKYMFALYFKGVTASGNKRSYSYRLYFQNNMYNIQPINQLTGRVFTNFNSENHDSKIFRMILKNEIE